MDTTTPGRRPRVLLLFGGRSGEHPISCVTAAGVLRAIDRERWDVLPVGITREGRWVPAADDPDRWSIADGRLPEVTATAERVLAPQETTGTALQAVGNDGVLRDLGAVDVVFPLLHGPYGEDGTLQGLLELADRRYVGSGVLASAVGMDKHVMKQLFLGAGLPVGPYVLVRPGELERDPDGVLARVAPLGLPVFVKPARAGSSLGITRVTDPADLPAAIAEAARHDPKVLVEAAIVGREIELAVLGPAEPGGRPRVSVPGEIVVTGSEHAFYDFEAKYLDDGAANLHCPADLPPDVAAEAQRLAAAAFEAIDCEGLARVDLFVTADGPVVNEINTMPGFTPISMYPKLWQASGLSYPDLIEELLRLALTRPLGLR